MRTYFQNPKLKIDLGRILGKNSWDGLVRPIWELAKLVTETSSKREEPKIYNEIINNFIYGNR